MTPTITIPWGMLAQLAVAGVVLICALAVGYIVGKRYALDIEPSLRPLVRRDRDAQRAAINARR